MATIVANPAMKRVAFTGVLYCRWVCPNHRGRVPSRPMANMVRAAAVAHARHTTNADRMAAIEIRTDRKCPEYWVAIVAPMVKSLAHLSGWLTPTPIAYTYVVQT